MGRKKDEPPKKRYAFAEQDVTDELEYLDAHNAQDAYDELEERLLSNDTSCDMRDIVVLYELVPVATLQLKLKPVIKERNALTDDISVSD